VKDLKKAYLRVSVQTGEQFEQAAADTAVDLIYLDSGLFPAADWKKMTDICHKGTGGFGKLAGLKLPQIWRKRVESYLTEHREELLHPGFDVYLAGNPEEVLWLSEQGIAGDRIITDASVYSFNSLSGKTWEELTGIRPVSAAWSQELNFREMLALKQKGGELPGELIVYGRTPLMVTAQCLRKTSIGCDRRISLMWMKDRTSALMPVRNCCTFCMNTIYNAVPTVLFDLTDEIRQLEPASVRYEFTSESKQETASVLSGICPAAFTRGHFKRGVL